MESCSICYENICKKAITNCNHVFCKDCFLIWSKTNSTCPICRQNVSPYLIDEITTRSATELHRVSKISKIISNLTYKCEFESETREEKIQIIKKINKILLNNLWFLSKHRSFANIYINKMLQLISIEKLNWIRIDLVKIFDYLKL